MACRTSTCASTSPEPRSTICPSRATAWFRGYQLSTIFQYQTGNPVNIIAGSSSFNGVTGLLRPTQVGPIVRGQAADRGIANVTLFQSTGGLAYGGTICDTTNTPRPAALRFRAHKPAPPRTTAPTVYTGLGTMQRNAVTGPGYADLDLSGEKDTKIFEGLIFYAARRCLRHPQPPQLRSAVGQCPVLDLRPDLVDPLRHKRWRIIAAASDQC